MDRAAKKQFVDDMESKLQRSQIVILMNYSGLTVEEMNNIRRKVEPSGVEFKVVKNTLVSHAMERVGISGLDAHLVGPTGVFLAFGDPVGPVKALTELLKTNEKLQVKAAWLSGRILNLDDVKQLANMPSREVLLGQLLGTLQAPMAQLVGVLSAVPGNFIGVLQAYKDKLGQDSQP